VGAALRLDGIKVRGTARPASPGPAPQLLFGPSIGLAAAHARLVPGGAGQSLELALRWVALGRPAGDYTVSVQVRDAQDHIVVQADAQPQQNGYPTSFWEPGEVIDDGYSLSLPADLPNGDYGVYVCLYERATMERLPVSDRSGATQPNREVELGALTVRDGEPTLRLERGMFSPE